MLDGNARFNLATFVTTWMDEEADRLYAATFDKNMVDKDEYPQTAEIEARCVRMLADLWHAPTPPTASARRRRAAPRAACSAGSRSSAAGSSRRAAGKPTDRPNIVMGDNVQVVWEKFANYWDVEPRYVPLEGDVFHLTAERLPSTSTRTRSASSPSSAPRWTAATAGRGDLRHARRVREDSGVAVPVHVDAASGGFIAPFVQPDMVWDFRLPRVVSIQASGHKFGLVYPGVGWVLWRTRVPAGGPGLPRELPRRRHADLRPELLPSRRAGRAAVLPVPASRQGRLPPGPADLPGRRGAHRPGAGRDAGVRRDRRRDANCQWSPSRSAESRSTTATTCPASCANPAGWCRRTRSAEPGGPRGLRVVVRNGFSHDMAELFLRDLRDAVEWLDGLRGPTPHNAQPSGFHH